MESVSKIISEDLVQYFEADKVQALFTQHDEDKNGFLDKGEMAQLMKEVFRIPKPPKPEPEQVGCGEYDAIVAECIQKGEKWTDPVFPPKARSICPPE